MTAAAAARRAPTVDERNRSIANRILAAHDTGQLVDVDVALGEAIAGLLSIGLGTLSNALAVEAVLCRVAQALGIDPDKET